MIVYDLKTKGLENRINNLEQAVNNHSKSLALVIEALEKITAAGKQNGETLLKTVTILNQHLTSHLENKA